MLRQSYTAVVERAVPLQGAFATEPYEVGWAHEAVIFFKVRADQDEQSALQARVQLSPDGIDWVDEGTVFPTMRGPGLWFVQLTNFGNWLRIVGRVGDPDVQIKALISIALKA